MVMVDFQVKRNRRSLALIGPISSHTIHNKASSSFLI